MSITGRTREQYMDWHRPGDMKDRTARAIEATHARMFCYDQADDKARLEACREELIRLWRQYHKEKEEQ